MSPIYKLLLSDRDEQELLGIQWLLSTYSLPVRSVITAGTVKDLIESLEKEKPDILCIELDMVPAEQWDKLQTYIHRFADRVIAITAESTFERAMQAISLKAIDLWVKPLSFPNVKKTLQQSIRLLANYKPPISNDNMHPSHFEALFIDDQVLYPYPIYVLKSEDQKWMGKLKEFIGHFDFYNDPIVAVNRDHIVLIFNQSFPNPIKQAQRLLWEWENEYGKALAIAVHAQEKTQSLNQVYQKLLQVMETTFFTGYKQVVNANTEVVWKNIDPFLTMEEQRKWVSMLEDGDISEIKKWMYEDFFDMDSPYPEPGLLRTRLTSILAQIRRYMHRKGIGHCEDAYQQVFHAILYGPVLYRIVQAINLFLNDILSVEVRKSSRADIYELALVYLQANYQYSNLSLSELADHVGRSASYLSHLLSKKYKQSFSELLMSIRIEKAKRQLETTDDAIQDVAASVGFQNPNYFSRVFKSHTGKTPREWKKKKIKK